MRHIPCLGVINSLWFAIPLGAEREVSNGKEDGEKEKKKEALVVEFLRECFFKFENAIKIINFLYQLRDISQVESVYIFKNFSLSIFASLILLLAIPVSCSLPVCASVPAIR